MLTPYDSSVQWACGWADNRLWCRVPRIDGGFVWVGIPAPEAHFALTNAQQAEGISDPDILNGDIETLNGFFKRFKRFVKRAPRAAKKLGRSLARGAAVVARKVDKTVRHPALRGALMATAVAFPAVGAPALKALNAAARVTPKIRAATKAADELVRGRPVSLLQRAQITEADRVRHVIKSLPPREQAMLLGALRRFQA
jgi:hypothetical protein